MVTDTKEFRQISNKELADLPCRQWENPTVDTFKYIQNVMVAWEVPHDIYCEYKKAGNICLAFNGYYYVA